MQAAIYALRNICENNEENKKFVEGIKKEGKININKILFTKFMLLTYFRQFAHAVFMFLFYALYCVLITSC